MKPLTVIAVVLILLLALFLVACQQSTVISSLEAAVSAAEIAIPVIGAATGLNPQTAAAIVRYLQEVNIATAQAAGILANSGLSSAQKAAAIVQAFAKVASGCNCLPPGTPQEVVTVVNAVAQAVLNFLTNFKPTPAPPPVVKVTASTSAALAKLRTRSEQNAAKLKGVKK